MALTKEVLPPRRAIDPRELAAALAAAEDARQRARITRSIWTVVIFVAFTNAVLHLLKEIL